PLRRVCVFAGSRPGARPGYLQAATALGRSLGRRGLGLVYGGASVGLMGAGADAGVGAGAEAVGGIPKTLVDKEGAHARLSHLLVVHSMHERKAKMAEMSDAFVALPGGFGTWEELFEVITWGQLGLHHKPVGLLDAEGYYAPLVALVDAAIVEGFIPPDQ